MDWNALSLSLKLSAITVAFLLPMGLIIGRFLAYHHFYGKSLLQALFAIPLILPPTVLGYYLLVLLDGGSFFGHLLETLFGQSLVFSFEGLVIASIIFNLPFAIQPIQASFESIPREIREAAACCGLSPIKVLLKIELPLAWTGIISAMVMTFAHTLGEFGIVLMVGGNIPEETKTLAISIYDRVQAFDNQAAGIMSAFLLIFSVMAISFTYLMAGRYQRRYG
ncbi:MAG: molybdate ABC transporter permease subunit [Methylococcales bacterium]|nr:molybdate ABC transporter permease subunit [Methylococcales bacterium]MCK5924363.1 molybdate ABC transporter permease subunit [Methylococcales bacterium]